MSTEIKPGDTIVTIQDAPSLLGYPIPKGTHGTVIRSGPPIVGPYSVYARFGGDRPGDGRQVRPGDVAVVPATPAPLDPALVKAGDTVTLERNRSTVTGPAHIGMPGAISLHLPGSSIWINNSDRADDPVSGGWTLTGHQPAPEPEPEWPSGGFAEATVNGETVRGLVGREPGSGDGPVFVYWNEFAGHVSVTGAVPADVRPLVVIDPAAVDAFDLASRAVANLRDKGRTPDIDDAQTYIREALAELGLDGAS